MRRQLILLTAIGLAAAMTPPAGTSAAWAQSAFPGLQTPPPPPPQDNPLPAAASAPAPLAPIDETVAFNHAERWIIPDYFGSVRELQLRASRSKKYERDLPPGLTQPPAKGDHLSAEAIAGMRMLPGPLLRQLPPARPDTLRRIAGQDVLMLRRSTGEVLDVLRGVIH